MHPLFIAIKLPPEIKKKLRFLSCGVPGTNWVEREKLHITVRYIGCASEHLRLNIIETLQKIDIGHFKISLSGLGHFNKEHEGIIWSGVEADKNLYLLRKELDRSLRPFNFYQEPHSFIPHVSLGYYKNHNQNKIDAHLNLHRNFMSESFTISEFFLYESKKWKNNTMYNEIASYPLH